MEYLLIKDTQSGKTFQVLRQPPNIDYICINNTLEAVDVKKQSIRKAIRGWMKDAKHSS